MSSKKLHTHRKNRLIMWGVPIEKPVKMPVNVHPKREKLVAVVGVLIKMERDVDVLIGCLEK